MFRDRMAPARIGVLIYDGVEPIDIGGTVGVVSMATRVLPSIEVAIIAPRAGSVQLAGGLVVTADHGLDDAPTCDVLIVCGGPGWPAVAADPAVLDYLRRLPVAGVASVCTGAMILGAAGVLDGRMATTRRNAVGREAEAPLASLGMNSAIQTVVASLVDADVVTGGGVSLAIDTTLYLLERLYGPDAASDVATTMEYDRAFAANAEALGVVRPKTIDPRRTSGVQSPDPQRPRS